LVGDRQVLGGSGDGDDPAMMSPVMVRTDQDEIVEFGGSAVLPMHDVVGVQTTGGSATGDHAAAITMLQHAA
jgi:hypothetical protein